MDDAVIKQIMIALSVVFLSALVNIVLWTLVLGYGIMSDAQTFLATTYTVADTTAILEAGRQDEVDSLHLYRLIENNSGALLDYSIQKKDGTPITNLKTLLDQPRNRYTLTVTGTISSGFILIAKEKVTP